MRVTIILDSGGFLIDESTGPEHLDVGYFESAGPHDIEVSEDGKPAQAHQERLGTSNDRIDVQHLAADGTVKSGVKRSASFKNDILRKEEIYPTDAPDFIPSAYDCILRFHSGTFESSKLKDRVFKEYNVSDNRPTGKSQTTRAIANDIHVQFDLDKGEELRLRREKGADVWSSSSLGSGAKLVEVKLLADDTLDSKYFQKALRFKGSTCHKPNPDPPPMNGNDPGAGTG